ncbi:MAG TPA: YlxR family protein [Oscillospiraceae bacterium]|nr:YlxR family protein [Oscillospiraceae bacterium]
MPQKKIPMRMCKGCSEMKPKRELIRVVKSPEGEISIDLTGKKSGRGVYVCKSLDCLKKARKSRRFEKDFQCRIEDEIYEVMENELKKQLGESD